MTPRRSTGSESRNVAILLGAGSSIPARFPSTTELTDRVLSGEGVIKCSDDLYYLDANGTDQADSNVCRVKHVIRRLYAHADRYYSARRGRQINYEDLFFLARQAADDVQGELENPAVESFVRDLRIYIAQLPKGPDPIYLLEETCYYIADVVRCLLCSPNMIEGPHLAIFADLCERKLVSSIATLCHDTHIETFLQERDVALVDGFSQPTSSCTEDRRPQDPPGWNGDFDSENRIPFLKLHGSVNWYSYEEQVRRIHPDCNGQYAIIDGNIQDSDGRPELLIGTFNKIADYSSGIFRDIHYHFRRKLKQANCLIVCGYSFGDKAINSELIDWYVEGRRLVVIDPNPDLRKGARGAIRKNWDKWQSDQAIKIIRKDLEDVKVAELEAVCSE